MGSVVEKLREWFSREYRELKQDDEELPRLEYDSVDENVSEILRASRECEVDDEDVWCEEYDECEDL